MSWRDRPYSGSDGGPELRLSFPRPTTAVTWLIAANGVIFLLDTLSQHLEPRLWHRLFGLSWAGLSGGYVWQPLTYMFVHGGPWHLLMNILGLYIFGVEFERTFGRERFLSFYGLCGFVGGLGYLVLSALSPAYRHVPLMGASGAVYGLLVAAIIFFPHIRVVLIIFPIPIRVFGLIVAAMLVLQLLGRGGVENLGGEVCHWTGAGAGIASLYFWRMMPRIRIDLPFLPRRRGAWQRRLEAEAAEQEQVDRILQKVARSGLASLTRKERRVLERATQRQRERDRELHRAQRL